MNWKIATFNVNGIRARLESVMAWLQKHDPHVVCLQEIKCEDKNFPHSIFRQLGYNITLRGQKAFNGVATLTKMAPREVIEEFAPWESPEDARFIVVLVDNVWVVNTYVPQGRSPHHPAFQYKLEFFRRLGTWFHSRFHEDDLVVWLGDMNVAPTPLDLFDPLRHEGSVGFHPAEREALQEVVSWGFTDLFRLHHPEKKQYTFWDYRLPKSFQRNLGWRLDHIFASSPLAKNCRECLVHDSVRGENKPSDHAPVLASINLPQPSE